MKKLKQSVGIDISKDSFTACLCTSYLNSTHSKTDVLKFKNEKKGFNQLIRWVRKIAEKEIPLVYLMEATGVYYEQLAYYLTSIKQEVHVVLPNTSKHYFKSLNIKTKTDAIDAKILGYFGLERQHKSWLPPSKNMLHLRNLTRYYVQLQEQKTSLLNIKHSKEHSQEVQKFILKSNQKIIDQISVQLLKIKKEIEQLVNKDENLKTKIDKILTIKGVGLMTVVTVISETMGFQHIKSGKQLASYAGYDVVQRESGTSIKGKTRISKKGNKYIRKSLYFPAMVSCRFNARMKENYLRIIRNKPAKMIGQVAIQRKLLILIYTLWKNNTEYDSNYIKKVASSTKDETTQDRILKESLL